MVLLPRLLDPLFLLELASSASKRRISTFIAASITPIYFKRDPPGFRAILAVMDEKRDLLRHTLATLAYRATRALDGAPESYATFESCGRQPIQILAHMGDLFDWALSAVQGSEHWHNSTPLPWPEEKARFFSALASFDAYLASDAQLHASVEALFQGPIADALTHVGQLAMQRRLAGLPTRGENFFVASIAVGQVSAEQPVPVRPFR